MPEAVEELMAAALRDDDFDYKFGVSYVEIYNEKVKDLLSPDSHADLEVREDAKHGTHIQGAVELAVASAAEIMEHMQRGSVYRTTEATNCNEVSSRSHAVLQVTVKAVQRYGDGGGSKRRLSKLSLIDLAGSERAYKTDNRGQRLVEGRNINRSLLSLANCINALADRTRKGARRPPATRDSRAAARQCFFAQARAVHVPSPRLGASRCVRRHGGCIGAHVPYRDSRLVHSSAARLAFSSQARTSRTATRSSLASSRCRLAAHPSFWLRPLVPPRVSESSLARTRSRARLSPRCSALSLRRRTSETRPSTPSRGQRLFTALAVGRYEET